MITKQTIPLSEIISRIVKTSTPERIILFGSRARGNPHSASDLDLLVIEESEEPRYLRAVSLYQELCDLLIPMDIIVYTPAEIEEWRNVHQAFVTTAIREGKVIYERKK